MNFHRHPIVDVQHDVSYFRWSKPCVFCFHNVVAGRKQGNDEIAFAVSCCGSLESLGDIYYCDAHVWDYSVVLVCDGAAQRGSCALRMNGDDSGVMSDEQNEQKP